MKLSYNWLKEHVALDLSTSDLSRHLLMLGFEVADVERRGPAFTGVVTAQILQIDKHPNADRLSLCVVDDGKEKLQVVCGAKNIAVGQKIPLARVGARLPGDFKITKSKIRGVESNGMICSSEELGIGAANGGILVLDPATEVGADFAKKFGESDEILDVEITPNRPDCLSHLGMARELAAYFRLPLKTAAEQPLAAERGSTWPVHVDAPQACPRYIGRAFEGLRVGPSPAWLASKLEAVGLRPINNLVDVTNFILMDIGQPLHAFDLDKLEGGQVRVRYAKAGESIKALDGKDYALSPEILVIADGRRPQAIAGVMGGQDSGVTEKTARAFLEAAYFDPPVVRKSSQKLRLRSDSSYRFERGADIAAARTGSLRAARLILELCGKDAAAAKPVESGNEGPGRPAIVVSAKRVNEILGSRFGQAEIEASLKPISAGLEGKGDGWSFAVPTWRGDLETVWDLAEEVARLQSYEKIAARLPTFEASPSRLTRHEAAARKARERLRGLGLLEAYNYDFISEKALADCRMRDDGSWARLANPVSEEWTILRPSLLPGLVQSAAGNARRGAPAARLFELGKVYAKKGGELSERHRLSAVLYGPAADVFWKPARTPSADFPETLGLALELLAGIPGVSRQPFAEGGPLFNPGASVCLKAPSGAVLATVGELHPQAARAWDLERSGVTLIDVDFEALCSLESPAPRFKPFSAFPSVRRDLSVVLEKRHRYDAVQAAVRSSAGADLTAVELIDVFEGKAIPEKHHSLTLRLTFGRDDRTLKDSEVNEAMERVTASLKSAVGAQLRG